MTDALSYPLSENDQRIIEKTQFDVLNALKFKGGLPVLTAVPTYQGSQGEIVEVDVGGVRSIYCYMNGNWIQMTTSDLSSYLQNIIEDTTPQLGGDLDLNGHNLDFPTTANISDVLDEDDMASDSATKLATQQSIKAYVDGKVGNTTSKTAGLNITAGQAVYIGSDGKVYPTDASLAIYCNGYIGFATESKSVGQSCIIQILGINDDQSGLTIGSTYYLKNATSTKDQEAVFAGSADGVSSFETNWRWQSFKTGASVTHITKLVCGMGSNVSSQNYNIYLKIYSGEGIGGSLLYSQTFSAYNLDADGDYTFNLTNPLPVSSATTYTMAFYADDVVGAKYPYWNYSVNRGIYADGRADTDALDDYWFKTYYLASPGLIDTSVGTVTRKVGVAITATNLLLKDS